MSGRVLILNRGEIAARACRAAHELGFEVVLYAVEGDSGQFVQNLADVVYNVEFSKQDLNPFMDLQKIEEALLSTGCQWLYPGYGFLSEASELAELCQRHRVKFIGPSPENLKKMSDKLSAFNFAKQCGLKTLELPLDVQLEEKDFPILLKAVHGGGGRGNAIVQKKSDLQRVQAELSIKSKKLFHDERILFERYLQQGRHVELQILGTKNFVKVLGTRDCSIQRKFQKVIEEGEVLPNIRKAFQTLIPKIEKELHKMCYEGAGTLEFLWDEQSQNLYFLEMNTRIQVEHPVTEMLTGLDLVKLQFQVALDAEVDLHFFSKGHSLECRLYAEDPSLNFFPDVGQIIYTSFPHRPFCRWDLAVKQGEVTSPDFDPLIAKLIVHGENREQAVRRCLEVLQETVVHGVKTNLSFLIDVVSSSDFANNKHHTSWLESSFLGSLWHNRESKIQEKPWDMIRRQFSSSQKQDQKNSSKWKRAHRDQCE